MQSGVDDIGARPSLAATAVVLLLICEAVVAMSWHEHPSLYPDSSWYILLAQGHPESVMQPFCKRVLHPATVRAWSALTGVDIQQSFFDCAVVSLFVLAAAVAWFLRRAGCPAPLLVAGAVLCTPLTLDLFAHYCLPDLFCGMLMACFFLLHHEAQQRPQRSWMAMVALFLLWLVRESTLLLSLSLVTASLLWKRRRTALAVLVVTVCGMAVVAWLNRSSKTNIHAMQGFLYLVLKVVFCFIKNVLGVTLWSDTLAGNVPTYPHPLWTFNVPPWLPLGSIRQIGICGFDPMLPATTAICLLTVLGVAPSVLAATLLRGGRRVWSAMPQWLSVIVGYSIAAYFLGPIVGHRPADLVGYAWPGCWLAAPLIFFWLRPTRAMAWKVLACHGIACWAPFAIHRLGGVTAWWAVLVLALAVVAQVVVFRIVWRLAGQMAWGSPADFTAGAGPSSVRCATGGPSP